MASAAAGPRDVKVEVKGEKKAKKEEGSAFNKCWDATFGVLGRYYSRFALTRFGAGIDSEKGAFFNLVFSHIIFWAFGFPALNDYQYTDDNQDENGAIPSGPNGSGVGIITSVLCILATILWFLRAGRIWVYGRALTVEEEIEKKRTTMRQASMGGGGNEEMAELERKSSAHDIKEAAKPKSGP